MVHVQQNLRKLMMRPKQLCAELMSLFIMSYDICSPKLSYDKLSITDYAQTSNTIFNCINIALQFTRSFPAPTGNLKLFLSHQKCWHTYQVKTINSPQLNATLTLLRTRIIRLANHKAPTFHFAPWTEQHQTSSSSSTQDIHL